jgi:hypothetical protein
MNSVSSKFSAFDYLRMAETRLDECRRYHPESSEVQRYQFAVEDLKSKMTDLEIADYDSQKNASLNALESDAARAAAMKQMNENRDKPSI